MGYIGILSKRFTKVKSLLKIMIIGLFVFALLEILVTDLKVINSYRNLELILIPVLLILIRIKVACIMNFGYHIIQVLFPVMMRG